MRLVGSIATLTGGPTTEFLSGRLATVFGLSGSARSRITTQILSSRRYDRFAVVVPQQLLIVADDQEWCALNRTETGDGQKRRTAE